MFAGQVNFAGPSDAAGQRVAQGNVADGDDSVAAFAQLYAEVLGLSDEECSVDGASGNWFDTDAENALQANYNSSDSRAAMNLVPGVGELHFTGLDRDAGLSLGNLGVMYNGSSMARLMSHGREDQVGRAPSYRTEPTAAVGDAKARQDGDPGQAAGLDGNLSVSPNSDGVLNKSQLSNWMDAHALSRSSHHCVMYCRLGMEAAGLNTVDRPQSGDAGDYGPFLLRHGAQTVPSDSYTPQVGDVVVFDKTSQHPNGHIEIYDGRNWVSDFKQHSFSPYRDADSTPPYTIYRLS